MTFDGRKILSNLLLYGTQEENGELENRSITFSNGVYLALPLVYLLFIFREIQYYILTPLDLVLDQLVLPIFIVLCLFFLYLNKIRKTLLSRLLFLGCWPLLFHILPIIYQNTPDDYYVAYPFGLVFHGVLIHSMISRKTRPVFYWGLLFLNLLAVFNFLEFLQHFDDANVHESLPLFSSQIYQVVIFLYWLLFNLTTFYFVENIDYNLTQKIKDKNLIEEQTKEISMSLQKIKATQNQLVQSEKMASVGNLVSGVAHELNNPLNVISGGLEVIKKTVEKIGAQSEVELSKEDREDLLTMLKSAEDGTNRVSKIVGGLMVSVKETAEKVNYDLSEIVDNVLHLSQFKLEGVEIVTRLQPIKTLCFPSKIQRAISGILDNAIYWSKKGRGSPKVIIEVSRPFEKYEISISNNGPEIPKDHLSSIFDPFFTTKDQGEGAGLGLYHVYQLVKENNGDIMVGSSDGLVKFSIILP